MYDNGAGAYRSWAAMSPSVNLTGQSITSGQGTVSNGQAWQLPTDNYVIQKLPGRFISPRPDSETDLNSDRAYYRKNHSQVEYRVRLCVKGMSWPLKYDIITAPAGTTIVGELARSIDGATGKILHTWPTGYATITCPAANMSTGTSSFTCQATGQDGNTLQISWTSDRDDTAFVFIDETNGNDANAGTFASPLESFYAGLWKSSQSDSTFAGKRAVFRTGTYVVGSSGTNNTINTSVKPATYMAFPGEEVIFDTSGSHFFGNGTTQEDLSVIDIICDGSRVVTNPRVWNIDSQTARHLFWGVSFRNTATGTSGTDNPCCIGHFDNSNYRTDIAIVDCVAESTVDCSLWVGFACDGVLIEGNSVTDVNMPASNGSYGINAKDDLLNLTVRANFVKGTIAEYGIDVKNQTHLGCGNQEVCWNTVVFTGNQNVDAAIAWNTSSTTPDGTNTHDFRNSAVAVTLGRGYRMSGATPPVPVTMIGNCIAGASADIFGTNYTEGSPGNALLDVSDFDSDGKLTGSARSTYLGFRGAEVAA